MAKRHLNDIFDSLLDDLDSIQVSTLEVLEQREIERSRMELMQAREAERLADRREAEMVSKQREKIFKRGERPGSGDFALFVHKFDKQILVDDYVKALITTLKNDRTISPLPDEFHSVDGFQHYRSSIRVPLQDIIAKMLKYRFLQNKSSSQQRLDPPSKPKIFFKVVSARGLIAKEGRTRDPYCSIDYGDLDRMRKDKKRTVFYTEVVKNSTAPYWNQHLNIEANVSDIVKVEVWDKLKDQFLGQVVLSVGQLIAQCANKNGYISEWFRLEPRDQKNRDKYVGGDLLLEAQVEDENRPSSNGRINRNNSQNGNSYESLQASLDDFGVRRRALFSTLMRACVSLDLRIPPAPSSNETDLLSPESITMLQIWSVNWKISQSLQLITYLAVLFFMYKSDIIPVADVLKTFHMLHSALKQPDWLSNSERSNLLKMLVEMREYFRMQVSKYKEYFPKNTPQGSLEAVILILRMIHRSPIFKQAHPNLPDSFREDLRLLMTESCIVRFQQFKEITSPLDETDFESVIDGLTKLAEMVSDEIEQDAAYFQKAFSQELDILRLTAENMIKYFSLTLEDSGDLISEKSTDNLSNCIFAFYKRAKAMKARYSKLVPALRFDVETWFALFIYKWLAGLETKTKQWVENAIKQDSFNPPDYGEEEPPQSESITILFQALYAELDFITDLDWNNDSQKAHFFQTFAKTIYVNLELYCNLILPKQVENNYLTQAQSFLSLASSTSGTVVQKSPSFVGSGSAIDLTLCVKLRNISYAASQLQRMDSIMKSGRNGTSLSSSQKRNGNSSRHQSKSSNSNVDNQSDGNAGLFRIFVGNADNLKPVSKTTSTCNPYVVIRLPDGTPLPQQPNEKYNQNKILTGSACEIVKTRVISDSLNPTWDDWFEVILPSKADHLLVTVLTRNLILSDDTLASCTIDLSANSSLSASLHDFQEHSLAVDMKPQGRLMLRFLLLGQQEDYDYWIRKSNEHLMRYRNEFFRLINGLVVPSFRDSLYKILRDNEGAPLSKSFFSSLTTSTVLLSDTTASGINVKLAASESECDGIFAPLFVFLNESFQVICENLSPEMAQEAIKRLWSELMQAILYLVVPCGIYGSSMEPFYRILNIRQHSMLMYLLDYTLMFFSADGQDLGIPRPILESAIFYHDLKLVLRLYFLDLERLQKNYDIASLARKEVDDCESLVLLRLIRLRTFCAQVGAIINADDSSTANQNWFESALTKRHDRG